MKILKSILVSFAFLFIFTLSAFAHTTKVDHHSEVTSKIENYLSSVDYLNSKGSVSIFVNFLVSEKGDLFTIDFMVDENDEIVVLSKEYEDEYYRVDSFSTAQMKQYSVPVSFISV